MRERGFVTVAELCSMLDVSEATVRRDLDALSRSGQLRRLRGGAGDVKSTVQPERDLRSFGEVAATAPEAKRRIAARAAAMIEDGEVVGLDSGTTVASMCPYLLDRSLTVVTASLAVVQALEQAPAIDIVVIGGLLRPNYRSIVGTWAEQMLGQIRLDKAFLGTSGVGADTAVLDSTPSEVPIKRALMAAAAKAYLLADDQKFPGSGFLRVCGLEDFASLITNEQPKGLLIPDGTQLQVVTMEETNG